MPALRVALKGLWHCPDGLIARAEAAMGLSGEAFEQALSPFDGLSPFLDAVKKYAPLYSKEKPRKLLEGLGLDAGVKGKAVERLWNTAVFFDTMPAFLSALRCAKICLCFSALVSDAIPMAETDVRMDRVITEDTPE